MHPLLPRSDHAPALVDGPTGATVTYADLGGLVDRRRREVTALAGRVVLLGMATDVDSVVDYLALTGAGATVALVDPASPPDRLRRWIAAYRPDAVLRTATPMRPTAAAPLDPLADRVLLPTSGTTGSPKFVRLSQGNIVANARQIARALRIGPDDRAVCSLPLFYSYGLSVLDSHLVAGASVVLSRASAVRPEFAEVLAARAVTTLAGVPFSFDVFERVRLFERDLPALRTVMVAGGKLATDRILAVGAQLQARGAGLWTMYGQTEATARIAVLPPEELPAHAGSVGWPVPDTTVAVLDPGPDGVGEIEVTGPNVMLGYATSRADLGTGDSLGGRLRTGDLGRLDDGGRLWVTGRLARLAKVAGLRISLDDMEAVLAPLGAEAVLDGGDSVLVVLAAPASGPMWRRRMERAAHLPPGRVRLVVVPDVPRAPSGKVDHESLARIMGGSGYSVDVGPEAETR